MLVALRTGAHAALGFASFAEYAERHLGYKPRWTAERLRVAEALRSRGWRRPRPKATG